MSLWQWRVKLLMSDDKDYLEFRCPADSSLMAKYVDQQDPYAVEVKCQKRGCVNLNTKRWEIYLFIQIFTFFLIFLFYIDKRLIIYIF